MLCGLQKNSLYLAAHKKNQEKIDTARAKKITKINCAAFIIFFIFSYKLSNNYRPLKGKETVDQSIIITHICGGDDQIIKDNFMPGLTSKSNTNGPVKYRSLGTHYPLWLDQKRVLIGALKENRNEEDRSN